MRLGDGGQAVPGCLNLRKAVNLSGKTLPEMGIRPGLWSLEATFGWLRGSCFQDGRVLAFNAKIPALKR
jgi:hypothetical protein